MQDTGLGMQVVEDHAISLAELHHLSACLLAWSLLREHAFAIEILMETVVIACAVVQEEQCWLGLAGPMAPLEKGLPPAFQNRLSRGLLPVATSAALPYPILRRMSRPRSAALCLAPARFGGAAAPCGVHGKSRGRGVFAGG